MISAKYPYPSVDSSSNPVNMYEISSKDGRLAGTLSQHLVITSAILSVASSGLFGRLPASK
ncbi:unnamed protein product [Haemonchus placei]|uniref:Uncharacterized protein n=1 Tax=Haemonchus placei TaxID=6290 RepID=A0A3P8AN83_HAEPC|nr:unnamed protein product [Haemonchus placei]